jgi:hypothetical protein
MNEPFTFWCCFYCDGELIVTSVIHQQVNVKCKCGAIGFIFEGKVYMGQRETIADENMEKKDGLGSIS